jgi:hypothetical protein
MERSAWCGTNGWHLARHKTLLRFVRKLSPLTVWASMASLILGSQRGAFVVL